MLLSTKNAALSHGKESTSSQLPATRSSDCAVTRLCVSKKES